MKFTSVTAAITLLAVVASALPHGSDIHTGGNNNHQTGGLLNNLAEAGVASDSHETAVTNIKHGHHRRSWDHGYSGHHGYDGDDDRYTVTTGGSNNADVSGAANNVAAAGVLADSSKYSETNVIGDYRKRDEHHVYADGNNNEKTGGALNNAAAGGVLAKSSKESYTNIVNSHH